MKNDTLFKVLIALVLAVIAGWLIGPDRNVFGVPYVKICGLIGQLFLNALHLVSVPLVCASIILGTARMGSESSFGALGAKTFGFYFLTSALAVLTGVFSFFLFFSQSGSDSFFVAEAAAASLGSLDLPSQGDLFDTLSQIALKFVPSNILLAASQGQMLGLIAFSILFGFFLCRIESSAAGVVLKFWEGIFQIMMKITLLIMKALPIGVFGLVAKVVATTGVESIVTSAWYFAAVLFGFFVYAFVILSAILLLMGINPIHHFRALSPALFTAFSTSSSAATLPVTMECIEKEAGVPNRICSFSIPLGTSINMSGGALNMCVASLFIATVYGIPLSLNIVMLISLMALLTSMGIAGIPSASLISVALILNTIGIPAEGIGLIIAVDRILDMFRTTTNVLGNATCAVLVARTEAKCKDEKIFVYESV